MTLVEGINCGFVTEAPTEDPGGSDIPVDYLSRAFKIVAPEGAVKVTEIGWWCDNATEAADFDVGIYTHNIGDNEPEAVVGTISADNAKGTAAGWKKVTGLNIPITAGTTYWLALQVDNTSTTTYSNYASGVRDVHKTNRSSLPNPWGTSTAWGTAIIAFYAVYSSLKQTISDNITITDDFSKEYVKRIETHTKTFSDTITVSDIYTKGKLVINKTISDIINITDDFSKTHVPIEEKIISDTITLTDVLDKKLNISKSFSDSITLTDSLSIAKLPRTFSDTFTLTDILTITHIKKPEPPPIAIKLEIESVEYTDVLTIKIQKNIGDFNSTSNFEIEFSNDNGQYDDTFSLNDDVTIYADKDTITPTTKIITGIIEDISYRGREMNERIQLTGRDYGAILMDIIVNPRVFKNQETSDIVKAIMEQNIVGNEITINNVNVTSTTIDKISFQNISLFDALKQLAEYSGFFFFVDVDKDLHFEEKETTSSGLTFNNTNITQAQFRTEDREIFNKVTVYGDRMLTGQEDIFTSTGGSIYNLPYKPHNLNVFVSGTTNTIQQPGGVLSFNDPEHEDVKFLVDFQGQRFIMTSGTSAGDNVFPTGSILLAQYEKNTPIIKIRSDNVSQTTYGLKEKIIADTNIKDPDEAVLKATTFLADHKDPKIMGDIDIHGIVNVTPGETCVVNIPFHNINNQTYTILNASYSFNKINNLSGNVLHITLNKKVRDFTDTMKDQMLRMRQAEISQIDASIILLQTDTGSVTISGTPYYISQRSIGSAFYFRIPGHDILCSPTSLIGDMRAGSIVQSGGF